MRLRHEYELLDLDDQVVAVQLGEDTEGFNGVIRLNETAAMIFRGLQQDTSEEALIDLLAEHYDSDRTVLSSDVRKCVSELAHRELIEY